MAKILIESRNGESGAADIVKMDGDAGELATLLLRAAASFLINAKRPDKSLYETCIVFGLSVYKMASEMIEKGQTQSGIYIEGASMK